MLSINSVSCWCTQDYLRFEPMYMILPICATRIFLYLKSHYVLFYWEISLVSLMLLNLFHFELMMEGQEDSHVDD